MKAFVSDCKRSQATSVPSWTSQQTDPVPIQAMKDHKSFEIHPTVLRMTGKVGKH